MADAFELEVATPERLLVQERASEAQIPVKDGFIGVLPGHAPLLAELTTGVLSYVSGGQTRYLSIHGGFVEVLPEQVRVLADTAERAEEIDVERAKAKLKKTQETMHQLMQESPVNVDPAMALAAMQRAQTRIEAAEKRQPR
jgi:F-type H+-transporting ATPase subunit epsilon